MADVTKRVNYFDRQFLRAAEFQDEAAYGLDRHRRHNRLLHTPGVGEGLAVSGAAGDSSVQVAPGTAYDSLGREIVLSVAQMVDVTKITGANATAYITISYFEQASDPSTDPGVAGNSTRTSEVPGLTASSAPPANANLNILLATVAVANGKVSLPPDNSVRSGAGAQLPTNLTVTSLTLDNNTVPPAGWPQLACTKANVASLENASLDLDPSREIFFQDNGQVRSLDDNHRLVFNRQNNLMELHEFGDIVLQTGGSPPIERMRVTGWGDVGIGTATPGRALEVAALDSNTGIKITGNDSKRSWLMSVGVTAGDGKLGFYDFGANAHRLTVDTSGNVGIGTTTPDRPVTIEGPNGTYLNVRDKGDTGGPYEVLLGADANGGIVSTMTNHDLQLRSGGNKTQMVLKASGNVGIGTVTPGFGLDVADRIRLRQASSPSAGLWLFQTTPGNDRAFVGMATDTQVGFWGNTGANWGLAMDTTTGNVGIGIGVTAPAAKLDVGGAAHASSFPTSSDERFKTDVKPLTNVLEKLVNIQAVSFEWNELYESMGRSTHRREIGVIAQNVEPNFPELVTTWDEEGHKAVDYGRLSAVLIEAVKELQAQNTALQDRIEQCEKNLGVSPAKKASKRKVAREPQA